MYLLPLCFFFVGPFLVYFVYYCVIFTACFLSPSLFLLFIFYFEVTFFPNCFLIWALYFLLTLFGTVFCFYRCISWENFLAVRPYFYLDLSLLLSFDFSLYFSLEVPAASWILKICKLFFLLNCRGDLDFDFDFDLDFDFDFDLLCEYSLELLFGSFPDLMNDLGESCFFLLIDFSFDLDTDYLLFYKLF